MLSRFYSQELIESLEHQLGSLFNNTGICPEQYQDQSMSLIQHRRLHKELVIVNSEMNEDTGKISTWAHFYKTSYLDSLEPATAKSVSQIPAKFHRRFRVKFVFSDSEGEENLDPVEEEASEMVPSHILINREENVVVLYNSKVVAVGQLPEWQSRDEEKDTIEMRVVGQVFSAESGREVVKVEFHPFSGVHIGVLTNKGAFLFYNVDVDLDKPEQEFAIFRRGEIDDAKGLSPGKTATSFCFGTRQCYGWLAFAVFFLMRNSDIYSLCPVVPGSLFMETQLVSALQEIVKNEAAGSAKQKADFVKLIAESASASGGYDLHVDTEKLANFRPQLQGPIYVCRSAEETGSRNCTDLVTFDFSPFTFSVLSDKGEVDMLFTFDDIEPIFVDNSHTGIAVHSRARRVPSAFTLFHYCRVTVASDPECKSPAAIYVETNNPFSQFVAVGTRLYQVTNQWYVLS